jgi:hypothetical protein
MRVTGKRSRQSVGLIKREQRRFNKHGQATRKLAFSQALRRALSREQSEREEDRNTKSEPALFLSAVGDTIVAATFATHCQKIDFY